MAAGTLSAGEVISIVETSFSLTITLGIQDTMQIGLNTQAQLAEPGSITPVCVFDLAVTKPDGSTGQIAKPIRMTWDFTPDVWRAAGGDFANLLMTGYNENTETWTPVEQVSQTETSATFEVPHFSLWAFAVRNAAIQAPTPADTGMGEASESGATNTLAIVLGVVALAGILGAGSSVVLGRRRT